MNGKSLSHWSKILACIIVFVALLINVIFKAVLIPIEDAIKCALFIALMFAPIDISIWFDIFAKKFPSKTIPDDGKGD